MAAQGRGAGRSEPETRLLRRIQAAGTMAEQEIARRLGLNSTDLAAMGHVSAAEPPMGPRDLSRRLGLSPAAVTEVVDRLQDAGHLVRERDTRDRRRVQLRASPQAVARVLDVIGPLVDDLDALAVTFTPQERGAIERYLEGVLAAYARFAGS